MKHNLTFEEVNNLLNYNPDTGILTWKVDRGNSAKIGNIAGCKRNGTGYVILSIFNKSYTGHRIGWLLYHKKWPKKEIDHINHNTSDNRIINLRDVSRKCNQRNKTTKNVSGYRGVIKENGRNKWTSQIVINNKRKRIGSFNTMEEAILARKEAEEIYWDEK